MLDELKLIYAGKKVFITGHTGFKGSWLVKVLQILGASVKGYSLEASGDDLYNLIYGDSMCESIIGDLRDEEKLKHAILSFKPDFIFHLAAQPLVRLSYEQPAETFEVNAIGTAHVLEAMRLLEKGCCGLFITTDKVYYNYEWVYPYRENDRLGGYDPYSASKACAELVIESYRNSFFNLNAHDRHRKAIGVCRAGNVIGGGDWAKDRLLPDVVKALSIDKKVSVRNPSSIRPWQHVLDPIVGYLTLGAKLTNDPLQFSQAYNFGPCNDDLLTVETIVKLAIENWGTGSFEVVNASEPLHEANLLRLDITKAVNELAWKPKWNAKQAVKQTILWYKEFHNNRENMVHYTEQQIQDFFKSDFPRDQE
jgi:CDP-glucose 4,6-dehydratase